MVLGRVFAKWRAVLFCTKSYYPLVGGTSPIPLNKLIAWLRNSYESLYFAIGIFFRNEKRREPICLKPTDSLLELSSDIVFSDTLLLLLFITFKELHRSVIHGYISLQGQISGAFLSGTGIGAVFTFSCCSFIFSITEAFVSAAISS